MRYLSFTSDCFLMKNWVIQAVNTFFPVKPGTFYKTFSFHTIQAVMGSPPTDILYLGEQDEEFHISRRKHAPEYETTFTPVLTPVCTQLQTHRQHALHQKKHLCFLTDRSVT